MPVLANTRKKGRTQNFLTLFTRWFPQITQLDMYRRRTQGSAKPGNRYHRKPVSIISHLHIIQFDPPPILTNYFPRIDLNIILPSPFGSFRGRLDVRLHLGMRAKMTPSKRNRNSSITSDINAHFYVRIPTLMIYES
jgi:hypothetical protein